MSDYLTVKQFADMVGVSSQRIYKLISTNSNGLATDIQQYCKSIKGRKYIHSDALKLFNDDSTTDNEIQPDSMAELNSLLQSEINVLKAETKALREQITDRDKTIDSLKADKIFLQQQIKEHTEQITNLTTALTAAQALHGMDKQQKVIEVKEQASVNEPAETETPTQEPEPPPQKLSFFQRLFRKRSE